MAVLKDLIVHGNSRFLNGAKFNTINAESIGAEEGIFNKLIATTLDAKTATIDNLTAQNATVVGLLDVQGELHTNAWTNANIANIGGSFYISPTVEPTDGTTTISITRNSATSWTVSASGTFATDFIKSGTATSGVAWPANSLVLITGDVVVGDMVYPLGTLKGTLSAQVTATAASTSKTITITGVTDAQNNNAPSVLQELYEVNNNANISNATFKKGKISLYKLGSNPIGILLSSMGTSSNSLIDIYGGVSTNPNVRIGHLAGLPNVNGSAPTGWGIYTDNGYFSGVIVSTSGKIANWNITTSSIQTGAFNTSGTMYFGSSGISLGTTFRVTNTGVLTATSGTIGGYSLTANYLQATDGTTGISVADNSTTASWAFWAGGTTTSTTKFRVDHNGVLYATGAQISGSVEATNGFVVKTSTGTTIATMDGSGIKLGSSGVDTNYNIFIDGGGINLRYNTNILNLINSDGMKLYLPSDQTNSIAKFGETSYIGKHNNTQSYIQIDYHSLQMIDKEGDTYFYVSDLRNSNGIASITDIFWGDGSTKRFNLNVRSTNTDYSVTVSDSSGGTISKYTTYISFSTAPTNGAKITVVYETTDSHAKAYTIGMRNSDNTIGAYSVVEGYGNTASGPYSQAIGRYTQATGFASHAEGDYTVNNGTDQFTIAQGYAAHAEGLGTQAIGAFSHSEGTLTIAKGSNSHAQGYKTQANGSDSHAEGSETIAALLCSHAEGSSTQALGSYCHAEGVETIAGSSTASSAHAEGWGSEATAAYSHAQNYYTKAASNYQTAIGRYNISDSSNTHAFIIGNGNSSTRSNALTVDWSGNVNIASGAKYKINGTALSAADVGAVPTSRTVNSKALSSNITLSASDVSAIALSDKYTRSSAGTIDWSNQTDGEAKIITKSALAYWNGCYSGTSSNLSRCSQGQIIGRNQICYANSRVDTFSSGQITIANSSLGVTTGAKPVGIILTPEYGTAVIMKYNYDSSTATNSVIQCWNHDGTAYSGAMRYFAVVFQNTWTTT